VGTEAEKAVIGDEREEKKLDRINRISKIKKTEQDGEA
jgi:hypothetical protein